MVENRIKAFGWQDYWDRMGPRRIAFISIDILLFASCGVLFAMAARCSGGGRPLRAVAWFVIAVATAGLGILVFQRANSH